MRASPKISNYKIRLHINTVKMGDILIFGMDNKISFVDINNNVCIGEFLCEGRVDSIRFSNDRKEIFMYTDQCKLYRIQKNQTKHFIKKVPNASKIRCVVPIFKTEYDEEEEKDVTKLSKLFIANDKFRLINSDNYQVQEELLDTDDRIVFSMKIMEDGVTAYAIMGRPSYSTDINKDFDYFSNNAYVCQIDIESKQIVKEFEVPLRKDTKMEVGNGKLFLIEPFRQKKMYYIHDNELTEVPVDDELVQLDDILVSSKHNKIIILCEKRDGLKLQKFMRILNLDDLSHTKEDLMLVMQTQAKAIRMCEHEKYMGISHSCGTLEIWNLKTLFKRPDANAYRVFKNLCD